jgi:hypothetical protein
LTTHAVTATYPVLLKITLMLRTGRTSIFLPYHGIV